MRSTGAASGARRLVRFEDESGVTRFGIAADPALRTAWPLRGCPFEQLEADESRSIKISRLLAPVQPPLIVCAGLNYHGHCEETKLPVPQLPVVILKSPYSVQHPGEPIVVPACAQAKPEVDYEGELAVVLKRACKDASPQEAMDCVLGYTAANDVTARRWQGKKGGMQWSRAKSFDTFCPLGPSLVLAAGGELGDLVVETRLNGSVVQACGATARACLCAHCGWCARCAVRAT